MNVKKVKFIQFVFVITIALILSPQTSKAQDWPILEGEWTLSPESCSNVSQGKEVNGFNENEVMTLSSKKFSIWENQCDIKKFYIDGDELELQMSCSAEGEEYENTITLKILSKRKVQFIDEFGHIYRHCK